MSTNTNGIATQANLYSLNSDAFPNWSGGLKCPTKGEILSGVNSNFTVTIDNTNNYSNNQLVKYSDITVIYNNNTQNIIDLTISVSYQPTDQEDTAGRRAQFKVMEVGGDLIGPIECHNEAANTTNVYHFTLTLKKNTPYEFYLKPISSVLLTGDYLIGGITGSLNETKTGIPSWNIGETPTGTIDIS